MSGGGWSAGGHATSDTVDEDGSGSGGFFRRTFRTLGNLLKRKLPNAYSGEIWPARPCTSSSFAVPLQAPSSSGLGFIDHPERSTAWDTGRTFEITALGHYAMFWVSVLNDIKFYNWHKFHKAVYDRPANQGLITVLNHNSELDEPCVAAALCGTRLLLDSKRLRWSFCAADVCFTSKLSTTFFSNAKALPIRRGGGLDQKELFVAVEKLNEGDWIQIFPEGRVYQNNGELGRMRPGVGKLILNAKIVPLVVPVYHYGMEKVRPLDKGPQVGHKVYVIVGDPIPMQDLIDSHYAENRTEMQTFHLMARRIGVALAKLRIELLEIVNGPSDEEEEEDDEDLV